MDIVKVDVKVLEIKPTPRMVAASYFPDSLALVHPGACNALFMKWVNEYAKEEALVDVD